MELEVETGSSRPHLSWFGTFGVITLAWAAGIYGAYGLSSYPDPYWLVEAAASLAFTIPLLHLFRGRGAFSTAMRFVGIALVLHSFWDALHWPEFPIIRTPIDAWIPRVCPWIDLPVGAVLVFRGE